MSIIKKFLPYDVYVDIFKIDYNKLYSEGRKIILFDLDNTIISYASDYPSEETKELIQKLKAMGFIVIIISNNHNGRINRVSEYLGVIGLANAKKPFAFGYKKIIKQYEISDYKQIIGIGDQIITDVLGGNSLGIDTILVNAIDRKTEKWYTRMNRQTENLVIKKIKKTNFLIYQKIKMCRGEQID